MKVWTLNDEAVWHFSQALPRRLLCGSAWQAAHSGLSPRKSTPLAVPFPLALPFPFPPAGFVSCDAAARDWDGLWHAAQARGACFPSSENFVFAAWSKGAPFQPVSLWHEAQSCLNSPRCGSWWQVAQGAGFRRTWVEGLTWHFAQGTARCFPRRGVPVLAWSNLSTFHAGTTGTWHALQSVPIDSLCGFLWQSVQSWNLRPFQIFPTWHFSQRTVLWAPSSGKAAFEWSKSFSVSLKATVTAWQATQPAPSFPLCGSWWHEAQSIVAVR